MSTLNPYYYAYNPELLAFENAWVQFIKNGTQNEEYIRSVIKDEVYESWLRCKELDLNPLSRDTLPLISEEMLNERMKENKEILTISEPFLDNLSDMIDNSGFRVDLYDSKGYILKSQGDNDTLEICKKTNSFPGANRLEENAGTNSAGLALITGKSNQIAGAEHYCQIYHRWACSSAPIIGPDKKILGVLNVSGMYELVHLHTLGMVSSLAKAIGDEIYIQKINKQIVNNNNQLRATLETVTDAVVYSEHGKVAQINQEMCFLLGREASDLIGLDLNDVIKTIPPLDDIMKHEYASQYKDGEITLKGQNRSFKCLFDFKEVFDNDKREIGKVIIMTRVDEIELLASKIKYSPKYTFDNIIGESSLIKAAIETAQKASAFESRVIIEGESGTGKEMFAQAIHNNSTRRYGPFVAKDCGSIPKELFESELFGYAPGAFTGAQKEGKTGLFEISNKGTLFLDEIGNMSMDMQIKLLRVLQEGVFTKVGDPTPIATDVRIIAATNADLKKAVEEGTFREDLFYRLNVFYIKLPSLKERKEDIPLLIKHFLKESKLVKSTVDIENQAVKVLQNNDWPGNIRQLNNAIERALIMSNSQVIKVSDLPLDVLNEKDEKLYSENIIPLHDKMREYVKAALHKNNQNVSKTAELLGISRTTLYKMIKNPKGSDNGESI